jgi:hypothetical protein
VYRHRLRHLILAGWKPMKPMLVVNWCGHGQQFIPWPNIVFTLFLIGFAFWRAIVSGYSPVGVFSTGADRAFVKTVRNRWRTFRPGSVSLNGRDR